MQKTEEKKQKNKVSKIVGTLCTDINCHIHGSLKARGRIFEGIVIRKFQKRITIEFGRMIYVNKYERYKKSKTKIHARLPDCMKDNIKIGDYIKVQECRPLSKITHFVVMEKIKDAEEVKNENKL
jgi:small subunit ribosomal protein S17